MTRRALLVGIDKYGVGDAEERLESLKAPCSDAFALRDLLRSSIDPQYDWTDINMLPSENAMTPGVVDVNESDLLTALQDLFSDHGTRGDDLLFYFAGHGVVRYGAGVLATSEGGGIPMTVLLKLVQNAPPSVASITVILDCCTAGMMNDIAGNAQLPINTSILTASFRSRAAYENSETGEGVFSKMLRDGLSGGAILGVYGHITVTSLATFVHERFASENHGVESQQPTFHAVLTNIPVLRLAHGSLTAQDVYELYDHFATPTTEVWMTHEHERPCPDDEIWEKLKVPPKSRDRDHIPESMKTPKMLEFDFFQKIQHAGLLRVRDSDQSLFLASGYSRSNRQVSRFSPVCLTEAGQAMWQIAKRYRDEQIKNQAARAARMLV